MTTPRFAFPQRLRTSVAGWWVRGLWVREDYPGERRAHPGHETYVERTYWVHAELAHDVGDAVVQALHAWSDAGEPDQVTAVRHWHYHDQSHLVDDPFDGLTGTQGGHDGYERTRRSNERGRVSDG